MDNDLIFGSETSDMLTGAGADDTQLAAAPLAVEPFADALTRPFDAAQVVIPQGENVVREPVTPGEIVELPFPPDAQFLARIDNGNLAIKVGDVTVILQGYVEAAGQTPPVIEAANGQPLDIATILASTDPNIDIQTAAGPAAGAQGADNTGAILAQFGGADGLGGFLGAGAQDGTDGLGNGPVDQTGTLFRQFGLLTDNLAPTAFDDAAKTDEDTAINGKVTATDPEGDPLTYLLVGATPAGVTLNPDGTWLFDPTGNYDNLNTGDKTSISFQYKANDGTSDSNTATVTIEIDGVNDAPVVADVAKSTDEDSKITGQLTALDPDNASATYSVVGALPAGVTLNPDGSWSFDPAGNYESLNTGDKTSISFQYKANDGAADSNTATVTIEITGVNDAPVVADVAKSTDEDTKITGQLTALDPDNASATYSVVGALPAGVTLNPDGSWSFDPTGNYDSLNIGDKTSISFQYKANDGAADSNVAMVTIDITGVNDAPKWAGGFAAAEFSEDTANHPQQLNWIIKDPDDTNFTITVDKSTLPDGVTYDAKSETIQFDTKGKYDYLKEGETANFTIKFTITDAHGGSVEKDVTLTIDGKNDAPVAAADIVITNVGTNAAVTFQEWAVLANDKDADGNALDVSIISTLVGGNSAFHVISPGSDGNMGFTDDGTLGGSFKYQATDGSANSASATITIKNQAGGDLAGTAAHEILVSGSAGDKIDGHGGKDLIFGGDGDDTVIFHNGDTVQGGADSIAASNALATSATRGDVLAIDHDVNFTKLDLTHFGGVETISTAAGDNGAGAQSLTIGAATVTGISDHTITPGGVFTSEHDAVRVDGDAVDQLYLSISKDGAGTGWADTGIDVNGYSVYAHETTAGDATTADAYVMVSNTIPTPNVHLNADQP